MSFSVAPQSLAVARESSFSEAASELSVQQAAPLSITRESSVTGVITDLPSELHCHLVFPPPNAVEAFDRASADCAATWMNRTTAWEDRTIVSMTQEELARLRSLSPTYPPAFSGNGAGSSAQAAAVARKRRIENSGPSKENCRLYRAFCQKYLIKLFPVGNSVNYYPTETSHNPKLCPVQLIELDESGDPTFKLKATKERVHDVSCALDEPIRLGRPSLQKGNKVLVWHQKGYVVATVSDLNFQEKKGLFTCQDFEQEELLKSICAKFSNQDFLPLFCQVILLTDEIKLDQLDPVEMNLFEDGRRGTVYCTKYAEQLPAAPPGLGFSPAPHPQLMPGLCSLPFNHERGVNGWTDEEKQPVVPRLSAASSKRPKTSGAASSSQLSSDDSLLSSPIKPRNRSMDAMGHPRAIPAHNVYLCGRFYQKYLKKLFPADSRIGYYPSGRSREKIDGTVLGLDLAQGVDLSFRTQRRKGTGIIETVECTRNDTPMGIATFKENDRVLVWYKQGYVLAEVIQRDTNAKTYKVKLLEFPDKIIDKKTVVTSSNTFLPPFCQMISADNIPLNELDPVKMDLFEEGRMGTVYCTKYDLESSWSSRGLGAGSF